MPASICFRVRGRECRDQERGRDDDPWDWIRLLRDGRGLSRTHRNRAGAHGKDRYNQSERPSRSRHALHRLSKAPKDPMPNTQEVLVAPVLLATEVRGAPKGIRTPDLHLERVAS